MTPARRRAIRKRREERKAAQIDQRIVDAVAEAWASIDGKGGLLMACRADEIYEDRYGYANGYDSDARSLIERAMKRGVRLTYEPKP